MEKKVIVQTENGFFIKNIDWQKPKTIIINDDADNKSIIIDEV